MEDKVLQAIEDLRNATNERLDLLSSQIEENTQILKRLEKASPHIQNKEVVNSKCLHFTPSPLIRKGKVVKQFKVIVAPSEESREPDVEAMNFIREQALKNKYDPDADPVLKNSKKITTVNFRTRREEKVFLMARLARAIFRE